MYTNSVRIQYKYGSIRVTEETYRRANSYLENIEFGEYSLYVTYFPVNCVSSHAAQETPGSVGISLRKSCGKCVAVVSPKEYAQFLYLFKDMPELPEFIELDFKFDIFTSDKYIDADSFIDQADLSIDKNSLINLADLLNAYSLTLEYKNGSFEVCFSGDSIPTKKHFEAAALICNGFWEGFPKFYVENHYAGYDEDIRIELLEGILARHNAFDNWLAGVDNEQVSRLLPLYIEQSGVFIAPKFNPYIKR